MLHYSPPQMPTIYTTKQAAVWVVRCWHGYLVWSEVQTCIWPSWCHRHKLSLASVKSRVVLPFWYRLIRVVSDKGPLNCCVCMFPWYFLTLVALIPMLCYSFEAHIFISGTSTLSEWQKTEINADSTSMVWPTLGSRTATEQNRTSALQGGPDSAINLS